MKTAVECKVCRNTVKKHAVVCEGMEINYNENIQFRIIQLTLIVDIIQ